MATIIAETTPLQAAFENNPYLPRINQLSAALNNPVPEAKNPAYQDEMIKAVNLFKRFLQKNIDSLKEIWPIQKQALIIQADAVKHATELNAAKERGEAVEQAKIEKVQKLQEVLTKLVVENQAINQKIKEIEAGCGKIQGFIVLLMQESSSPEQLAEFQRWSSENTILSK